jgi:hypothetical protein
MSADQMTGRLRNAPLDGEPELAERAREELRCAIAGLDLTSEERHVARCEGGYALQLLTEEVSGLEPIERPDSGPNVPSIPGVLLAGALESVHFEAIADELITEIEEGSGA